MEDHTISHIDQSFDSLSQLVTRQKSFMSSTSTQNEFEIAEEPTISEPNLKPNDYPLSIAKQLVIADKFKEKMKELFFIDNRKNLWPAESILKTVWAQKVKNIRNKTFKEIRKEMKANENIAEMSKKFALDVRPMMYLDITLALSSKFIDENTVVLMDTTGKKV
ncbi:hypothetical protein INT46_007211 [Mucor plumbeus]|uniref:Uncharacterized protein n=1 Tax=Mucor plumbeus TaxID=97098 RepID=A0A8H7USU4_9FUNG|nr:hypothetical protein INT46_007211 [Mucor plumbeus]